MPVDQEMLRTLQICPKDCGASLSDSHHIEQEDLPMLYQPRTDIRAPNPLRLLFVAVAGALASLFRRRCDVMYLDGMRPSELEDLGLRRSQDGGYRPFGG
jgi:uncharacterized protein YjiS (DUF1127 family)